MGGRREDYAQPISDSYLYAALGRAEAAEAARDALLTDLQALVDTWTRIPASKVERLIARHRVVSVPECSCTLHPAIPGVSSGFYTGQETCPVHRPVGVPPSGGEK
jgi:hypothetical protein